MPKYPKIKVQLTGKNGNAFVLIALVTKALKKNGVPAEEIKKFIEETMSGDYDNVLNTCMDWVEVL
jgi:hypothetical protein